MLTAPLPRAVEELSQSMGRELPLDAYHGLLRRASQSFRSVQRYGCSLVSCSDELNGVLRAGFERDVARALTARYVSRDQGTFPLSNISGRYEPGTFALVHDHFTPDGPPGSLVGGHQGHDEDVLVLIEIASHLGRRIDGHDSVYGQVDRLGQASNCCGALAALLQPGPATRVIAHPWFDKLVTYFGEARLAELRAMPMSEAMVRTAVVHVAMQAEAAVAEVLREAPRPKTRVLIAPLVLVDQAGVYTALPVGLHLLSSDGEATQLESGFSLRTTPSALEVSEEAGGLRVSVMDAPGGTPEDAVDSEPVIAGPGETEIDGVPAGRGTGALLENHRVAALEEVLETRAQMEPVRSDPEAWRVYARPLLRSLFQGLTLVAPEVGLAALLVDTGREWVHAHQRAEVLRHGPDSPAGRKALREIEAAIQQLGHEEAQAVLERLVADGSPLVQG